MASAAHGGAVGLRGQPVGPPGRIILVSESMSRNSLSAALEGGAWRHILSTIVTAVPVASSAQAVEVARAAISVSGAGADEHLRVDIRPQRVELTLQTARLGGITEVDVALSRRISDAVRDLQLAISADTVAAGRSVQTLEIAIDAMDIPSIRPFWKAVMGYVDEHGHDDPEDGLVDHFASGPTIWFQRMDQPRLQRNRIHFDITVPHDEADARVAAALAAGGVLVSDAEARAFWILADVEGNEVCVCTWQDRTG